jgi:hypothetical protein
MIISNTKGGIQATNNASRNNGSMSPQAYQAPASFQEQRLASRVGPQAALPNPIINRFGAVSRIMASPGAFVTITIANAATGVRTYAIGDPDGIIEAAFGVTWEKTMTVAGSTAAAFRASTRDGVAFVSLQYRVTASAAQFSNSFRKVSGNTDGSVQAIPLPVQATARPDFFTDKLLVFDFPDPIVLDSRNALTLVVNASETVNLVFAVGVFGF